MLPVNEENIELDELNMDDIELDDQDLWAIRNQICREERNVFFYAYESD